MKDEFSEAIKELFGRMGIEVTVTDPRQPIEGYTNVYHLPIVNKRTNASPTLGELARRHVKERKDHPVLKKLAFEVTT